MSWNSTQKDFSVIIPTFNRCNFLKLALASVIRQKGVSFEIIIGDNASTDKTWNIVKGFNDDRIRYFKNNKNLGYALNLKKCLRYSSGDYIFILADDDFILDKNTLAEVLKFMKRHYVGIGRIGSLAYDESVRLPYRASIASDKLIILRPRREEQILLKLFDFGFGFPSGLIFNNSLIDKDKIINRMGFSFFPLIFNAISKSGLIYIPNYLIVAHLSLRDIPKYWSLEKYRKFFIEEQLKIVESFFTEEDYKLYKKEFIRRGLMILPNIKYFTNNRNYFNILRRLVYLDKTLLIEPRFLILALSGLLPKFMIKLIRTLIIRHSTKKTREIIKRYHYFRNLKELGIE